MLLNVSFRYERDFMLYNTICNMYTHVLQSISYLAVSKTQKTISAARIGNVKHSDDRFQLKLKGENIFQGTIKRNRASAEGLHLYKCSL